MNSSIVQTAAQKQTQVLGTRQIRELELLQRSIPELRLHIQQEISANPVLEDLDCPLETPLSAAEKDDLERNRESDYPEDDFTPGMNVDEDAVERRQRLFDNVKAEEETLQAHLMAQLPDSSIAKEDREVAAVMISDLDDNGYYTEENTNNLQMAFGRSGEEIEEIRQKIMMLDPIGCAAKGSRECLLAQLDHLTSSPVRILARKIIDRHLNDIVQGRVDEVIAELKVSRSEYDAAMNEIRASLRPFPGRAYPGQKSRIEYVNPEIHAVEVDGWWTPKLDRRSTPEIRIAKRYLDMLGDPDTPPDMRAYVEERVEAARALKEAVMKRGDTLGKIATFVFDRQQDFFDEGFSALKPLTEVEVAEAVGVHGTTVSRAARNKYVSTPFGTVELRKFFTSGVKTATGEVTSQSAALQELKRIVDSEDAAKPYSDNQLRELLGKAGFPIARRTVVKYREKLGIRSADQRIARLSDGDERRDVQ